MAFPFINFQCMNLPWLSLLHENYSSYFSLTDWGACNMRECFCTLNSWHDKRKKNLKVKLKFHNFDGTHADGHKKFPPQRNHVTFHIFFFFRLVFQQSEKNDKNNGIHVYKTNSTAKFPAKTTQTKRMRERRKKQLAQMMVMTTTVVRENSQQRTHSWSAHRSIFIPFIFHFSFSLLK